MTTVSYMLKIQMLTAALAFLVGCGTTDKNHVTSCDLMDISWSSPAPRPQPNRQTWTAAQPSFVSVPFQPWDRDEWPKPLERLTLFTPPSPIRIERPGDVIEDNLVWLTLGSCLLGLLASRLVRKPRPFLHAVSNALMALIAMMLLGLCVVITAHVLPTIAFYLVVRNVAILADRAMGSVYMFLEGAIEYIGFICVPSLSPSWLRATPLPAETTAAPLPVPAAWTGDRPLDESWDDEEEGPPAEQKATMDTNIALIALLRINTLRQDLRTKIQELDDLEEKIRRSQHDS